VFSKSNHQPNIISWNPQIVQGLRYMAISKSLITGFYFNFELIIADKISKEPVLIIFAVVLYC